MFYFHSRLLRVAIFKLVVLGLALNSFSINAQNQAPPTQAPQEPSYQWPRSHNYDVQHYRIALSFDWAKQSIAGETTITFQPFGPGVKEIEIDAGDMAIKSVKLASGAALKYRYVDSEKLYVALDQPAVPGQDLSVVISYTATPKQGLTFIIPTEADPARLYQIWTQGEARTNHYWFPCYDYPNDKATSELVATADEKYQVISNGSLIGVQRDAANKTRTWHWKMDRPFSSYLVSLIVGQYEEVKDQFKGKPVVSYV
jgi:aminopeptidase N